MTGLKGEIRVIYKLTMNHIMRYDALERLEQNTTELTKFKNC